MNDSIVRILSRFFKKDEIISDLSIHSKFIILIKLYGLIFFLSILITFLVDWLGMPESINLNKKPGPIRSDLSLVFFGLLITPFHEELMFRLLLTEYNKRFISISFSLLISYVLLWIGQSHISSIKNIDQDIIQYSVLFILALPFYFGVKYLLNFANEERLAELWGNKFWYVFYSMSILFALLHCNYSLEFDFLLVLITSIKIIPFFILGLLLGFIRINMGFRYCLLFHLFVNLPHVMITVFYNNTRLF